MAGTVSVMNLSNGKAAYNEAACNDGECFEVFHSSVFCWFDFSALATLCRQRQIDSHISLLAPKLPTI